MGRLDEEAIAQLMRAAITGDREAYRRFFENITPMLDNMLRTMSPSLPSLFFPGGWAKNTNFRIFLAIF